MSQQIDLRQFQEDISPRYRFIKPLGRGTYGIVFSAFDLKTKTEVAIKQIDYVLYSAAMSRNVLREIKLLTSMNHQNIVRIQNIIIPDSRETFSYIYLVMELLDTDMDRLIRTNRNLLLDHRRYFVYQVLRALKYLHSANIVHRDLKPSNIFVNKDCRIKIGDFGLARIIGNPEDLGLQSEHCATLWYKSPELLLNLSIHGPPMDVWSVGCILAELIEGKALFPGESYANQITLIAEIIGVPSFLEYQNSINENAKRFMSNLPRTRGIPLEKVLPHATQEEVDLLKKIFTWNPSSRITIDQCLSHPFFAKFHDPFNEPVTVPRVDFDFEGKNLDTEEFRQLIWKEYTKFNNK